MTNMPNLKGWTKVEAIEFLSSIRQTLHHAGWEVGLTGSLLFNEKSDNDLDMILFPSNSTEYSLSNLHIALKKAGLQEEVPHVNVLKTWVKLGSSDTKHVEVWSYQGHRVDLFILR